MQPCCSTLFNYEKRKQKQIPNPQLCNVQKITKNLKTQREKLQSQQIACNYVRTQDVRQERSCTLTNGQRCQIMNAKRI